MNTKEPFVTNDSVSSNKKKKVIAIVIVVVILVILGVVLGIIFGLRHHKKKHQKNLILKTCEDLSEMSGDGNYTFGNDIDCNGKTLEFISSVSGIINGQGFTLKNYKVPLKKVDGANACNAIFGLVEGSISNLRIEGAIVDGNLSLYGAEWVGISSFACKSQHAIFTNMTLKVKMEVIIPEIFTYVGAGGLVGISLRDTTISSSSVSVDFNIIQEETPFEYYCVGGIIGSNPEYTVMLSSLTSIGSITTTQLAMTGGIGGCINGIVSNSSSSCNLNTRSAGGILAKSMDGVINNSQYSGIITLQEQDVLDFGGGIIGDGVNHILQNSKFLGEIRSEGNYKTQYIGGLLGSTYSATIIDCHSNGNITTLNGFAVGGLVGAGNSFNIANSTFNGNIYASCYGGGIIGRANQVFIVNTSTNLNITGMGDLKGDTIGGIAGEIDFQGSLTNVHTSGIITSQSDTIGGLVGEALQINISNSYSLINITAQNQIGGLLGNSNEQTIIQNSYYNGNINISNSSSIFSGGIIGLARKFLINQSCSIGSIVSEGNYDGGLIGGIENCSNQLILNSFSIMDIKAYKYAGGLVGNNKASTQTNVTNSFSTGFVNCGNESGGLIGGSTDPPYVSSSYWDLETSQQTKSNGGKGLSSNEMKDESSFIGWDFTGIWILKQDAHHPSLRILNISLS